MLPRGSPEDSVLEVLRPGIAALASGLLLTSAVACNTLWGVDDLSYAGGGGDTSGTTGAGGAGGQQTTSCEPRCAGRCAGADDGCEGVCPDSDCLAAECCDGNGECVAGQQDTQCGALGSSCVDCTPTGRTCGPVGKSFTAGTHGCLPPCADHLRFVTVASGDLGGLAGASAECALAAGASWHVVEAIDLAREPWQEGVVEWTGGSIVGLCSGNWCSDIDWGGIGSPGRILSTSSCSGFSSAGTEQAADGIYGAVDVQCGQWEADADGIDCSFPGTVLDPDIYGILCTDL